MRPRGALVRNSRGRGRLPAGAPMSSFKRRQQKHVKKAYRVRNWPEYEAGLRARGSLTVWLSLSDEGELKTGMRPR